MSSHCANPLMPRRAIIAQKIDETHDTFSLRLSLVDGRTFSCRPGQFNMLGIPDAGEAPFSFSSLDLRGGSFVHTIRSAGNVVGALMQLTEGDYVGLRGPYGNGWPLDKAKGKNVILIAGGIGMAPLRPLVYHILRNRQDFRQVYLLYGARTPADLLYKDELKDWALDITVLLSADEIDGKDPSGIHEGLVTTLFEYMDVPLWETVTFTCGPPIMMKFVSAGLVLDGQNENDIYVSFERRMKCGIGHCGHCQIGPKYVCRDGPVFSLPDITRFADSLL